LQILQNFLGVADELAFFCSMREVLPVVKVSNLYLMGVQVRQGEFEDLCAHASRFGRICERVQIIEENAIPDGEHYEPEKACN